MNDDALPPVVQAAHVHAYLGAVDHLMDDWRAALGRSGAPREGAAAWEIINAVATMLRS